MTKNIQYINIKEILSRLLRNKKLLDVSLEAVVLYTIDFIGMFGLPDMYEDKEITIDISNYKGLLPCDLISINQVKETCTNKCLRSMTDTFIPSNTNDIRSRYDSTYKAKGRVIFTSFEHGLVTVSYKSIPVDEDGFPLIIDNSAYLRALESYIKKEVFTMLFENGELPLLVLLNTQQEYCWRAGLLLSEFSLPSEGEMESIMNEWCTLILRTTDFDNCYKNLGRREYLIKH